MCSKGNTVFLRLMCKDKFSLDLRKYDTGFSLQRPGSVPSGIHVRFPEDNTSNGEGFPSSSFGFPLLLINQSLLQIHLPPLKECNSPDQARPYYILGFYVWEFFSVMALGWLQSNEILFQWERNYSLKLVTVYTAC